MTRLTVLETSERAVAWLPRGLMKTEPGDVSSGRQVPGHRRCAERDSWQRGAGREHGPVSVTTAGTWAWPLCSWTSGPDERPGDCFRLPICTGSPTPRAPHRAREPRGSRGLSVRYCCHSGCPQLGDPHTHGGGGFQTPAPFLQKAVNCPPEQNLLHTHTWAADPHPPNSTYMHTRPRNQSKGGEKAAAAAMEEPHGPGCHSAQANLTSRKGRLQAVEPLFCHALPQAEHSLQVPTTLSVISSTWPSQGLGTV